MVPNYREVLDGYQRLESYKNFFVGTLRLGKCIVDWEGQTLNLSNLTWDQIRVESEGDSEDSNRLKSFIIHFLSLPISVVKFYNLTEDSKRLVFRKVNTSAPITNQTKRGTGNYEMSDVIRFITREDFGNSLYHPLFETYKNVGKWMGYPSKKMNYDQLLAGLFVYEDTHRNKSYQLGQKEMNALYKRYDVKSNDLSELIKNVKRKLDLLYEMASYKSNDEPNQIYSDKSRIIFWYGLFLRIEGKFPNQNLVLSDPAKFYSVVNDKNNELCKNEMVNGREQKSDYHLKHNRGRTKEDFDSLFSYWNTFLNQTEKEFKDIGLTFV